MTTAGVLALQGDFAEHSSILKGLGAAVQEVRVPADLESVDSVIIPGGESTTITRLITRYGLGDPLRSFARSKPVWGTCAGMIVMARVSTDLDQETLGIMDVEVERNAFGRQVDSFETDLAIAEIDGPPLHAVFIRAPLIRSVGSGVKVLAEIEGQGVVAAREGQMLVTSFHPELTRDTRMHEYFLSFSQPVTPK